ncbi:hypothetical protein DD238_000012 [Peronospora effusa]|uniref:Uncharacterized protein n=1 Tax=Peronospora effusa TaxID=542832 RepID=A0A3M6VU04_9STRA|nr:hypothetical protein DD238_000012 [Peronospora effusa]
MTTRTRDGDSVGRLLRVLRDCELFHVIFQLFFTCCVFFIEAAIAYLDHVTIGIRSESMQNVDDVDERERVVEGRVLSLLDHKWIARLQAALTTVINAYNVQNEEEATEVKDTHRNVVCTMAGAAMMQSLRDCTASRTNCCIWGSQAEKLHVLLDWMMKRESGVASSTCDYARQLLLQWIQPAAEKQNQLAACLTLFELLQRRRRELQTFAGDSEISCLLGDRTGMYLDALCIIVDRGTIRVADSHNVKPSKLALVSLEALTLLCGDVAAQYMTSNTAAKRRLVDEGTMCRTVKCVRFILAVLRQWHLHSIRRKFLIYALQHLQSYVTPCSVILSSMKELGDENGHVTITNDLAALDVLCWHWETIVPLLCTRTDVSSQIRKTRPPEVLTSALEKWAFSTVQPKEMDGSNNTVINPEVIYAQLRYVCVLMDLLGGVKGCSKALDGVHEEIKARFLFFFIQGLSLATKNRAEDTVLLILKVMRAILLPSDVHVLNLLNSRDAEQELLSQLLHLHSNSYGISDTVSQGQADLEFFVADFIISRNLFITEFIWRVQDAWTQSNQCGHSCINWIIRLHNPSYTGIGGEILSQIKRISDVTQRRLHFFVNRKMLTSEVVSLVAHENGRIRRCAISCLSSLDIVSCIARLCTLDSNGTRTHLITSALGYLFTASTRHSFEVGVSWFIDACQFGSVQAPVLKPLASPHDWNDYVSQLEEDVQKIIADADERQEMQEKLFSLCFGPNGWSKHLQSAPTRSVVLQILLRKIFGSPRDAALLRMLREFVVCGWVDNEVFEMLGKQLVAQMMSLPRLSEDILNDSSFSAAKSLEGLLFSRLAPLLVLRMLPRHVLGAIHIKSLPCGREDLDHLNEYIKCQLQFVHSDSEAASKSSMGSTIQTLFHILGRSVVDPLEFKEVKMVATECLSKFPSPWVLPFVLSYLVAFLREATPHGEYGSSLIVEEESVPNSCGLVTAKLMVYYLNRMFSEDDHAYKDEETVSKALVVLIQIMEVRSVQDLRLASDNAALTDLQRGCIDCIALILVRLSANDSGPSGTKVPIVNASSLMNLLMGWIFDKVGTNSNIDRSTDPLILRVRELLDDRWSGSCHHKLSSQVRICFCNILLSAISRAENKVLASWKVQGLLLRIALATKSCSDDDVVAGGFQIMFSFLYKSSEHFAMEDSSDLQLARICFEATVARLETTGCEFIAMSGIRVAGALIGKFPGFIATLPPVDLQRLIDGYDMFGESYELTVDCMNEHIFEP